MDKQNNNPRRTQIVRIYADVATTEGIVAVLVKCFTGAKVLKNSDIYKYEMDKMARKVDKLAESGQIGRVREVVFGLAQILQNRGCKRKVRDTSHVRYATNIV